jgi:hypothetical protein
MAGIAENTAKRSTLTAKGNRLMVQLAANRMGVGELCNEIDAQRSK